MLRCCLRKASHYPGQVRAPALPSDESMAHLFESAAGTRLDKCDAGDDQADGSAAPVLGKSSCGTAVAMRGLGPKACLGGGLERDQLNTPGLPRDVRFAHGPPVLTPSPESEPIVFQGIRLLVSGLVTIRRMACPPRACVFGHLAEDFLLRHGNCQLWLKACFARPAPMLFGNLLAGRLQAPRNSPRRTLEVGLERTNRGLGNPPGGEPWDARDNAGVERQARTPS